MRKIAAVVLSLALFAACGGSSSSDFGSSGSGGLPLDQVASELAKSACAAYARCNKLFFPIAFSVTDCPTTLAAQFDESIFSDLKRVVTAGTASYDAVLGKACVDAVASGACSELDNDFPDACRSAFKGTVAAGGDCTISQECSAPDSRCDTSAGTCPGKCAPRLSAGIACSGDDDCALGLKCSKITSKCAAPPADGAACEGGVDDGCAAGLLCVGADKNNSKPGTCTAQDTALAGAEGSDCSVSTGPLCQPGLSCVITTLTAALDGKCQKSVASGAACNIAIPSECPVGQYCPLTLAQALTGATANCTDLPAENQPCAPDIALSVCGKDLICDGSKTCIKRRELGQSCTTGDECVSAHCNSGGCGPANACAM